MFIGCTFKNFMSFYGENVFSMRANSDKKYCELNTLTTAYGELIKSAFVFGANSSGKTNFVEVVDIMRKIVLAERTLQSRMIASVDTFLFSEASSNTPSAFEIEFIANDVVYEYGFEILKGEVNKEYLHKKTRRKTPVFTRTSPDFNDISLSKDMENVRNLIKNTRPDTLFLYWANSGNNNIAMTVCRWFESIKIFNTEDTSRLLGATIEYIEENTDGKQRVLDLLQKADANMLDFDVSVSEENEQNNFMKKALKKSYAELIQPIRLVDLTTKHYIYGENWEKKEAMSAPFAMLSAGTKKLFEIAGSIIAALEEGSVVFIDELDTQLHPMLVRFLVMLFNSISKNPNSAQLICTTHDVLLLNEDIRRDQVWFTEKDEYGVSKLYSLTDFKGVRKESRLLRQYLIGAFGAIPRFRDYFPIRKASEALK